MKSIKTLGIICAVAGMCLMQARASLNSTSDGNQPGNSGNAIGASANSSVDNNNSTPNSDLTSIGSAYALKANPAWSPAPNTSNTSGAQAFVPETSTIIAGILLLIPFGIQGVRQLRKHQQTP